MLNILLIEDKSDIGNRVRKLMKASGYPACASLDWLDRMAVLGYLEQNKTDVVILCAHIENEGINIDAGILREIRQSGYSDQILLVVEKHSKWASRIALDCDAEWVIGLENEMELVEKVLHRLEHKQRVIFQDHVESMQHIFADFVKDERILNYHEKSILFKDYLQEKYFQVVVIRILPPYRKRSFLDENNMVTLKGYEILINRLEKLHKCLIAKDGLDVLVCLIGNGDELHFGKLQLMKYINDMNEFNITISHSAAWVCMGSIVQRIQDISKSYLTARELLNERIFKGHIEILEEQNPQATAKDEEERFQIFDARKSLVNSLETFEELTIQKTLRQLKSNILSVTNFEGKNLFSIYKTLMSAFFQELESKEADLSELAISYATVLREYEYFWNVDEVFESIESCFLEGMNILKAQEENSIPAPIVMAKRYIRSYFNMPLTLKEISDYVGMNENYFSDSFSKHVKMTFKQYQTDLRIRHSIQMLLDKRYPMEDISDIVGYSDVKYFSRVFKRVTGIAPGEYRAKYNIISDQT